MPRPKESHDRQAGPPAAAGEPAQVTPANQPAGELHRRRAIHHLREALYHAEEIRPETAGGLERQSSERLRALVLQALDTAGAEGLRTPGPAHPLVNSGGQLFGRIGH